MDTMQKGLLTVAFAALSIVFLLLFWDIIGTYAVGIGIVTGSFYLLHRSGKLKKWLVPSTSSPKRSGLHQGSFDDSVERNRAIRWLFLALSAVAFLLVPGLVVLATIHIFPGVPAWINFPILLLGAVIGGIIFGNILPWYIIDVPQLQGFVTINKLKPMFKLPGSAYVIYGPGWHISFPWEKRSEKSNFSLEVFTMEWTEQVPGQDSQLKVTGSYQFAVDLSRSDSFIGIDEDTIKTGALDIIKARVSNMLANESADVAKASIEAHNRSLLKFFGLSEEDRDDKVSGFEQRYGINSVAVTISGIDLPDDVQRTRDAVDEAGQVINGISAMYGMTPAQLKQKLATGEITPETYNEMLDRFMANSGNAEMKIQAFKVHGLKEALPSLAKQILRG